MSLSISRLFEQVFENEQINTIKTEKKKAATDLLALLEKASYINTNSQTDKALIRGYVNKKYS